MDIQIRKLQPAEWEKLAQLRLEGVTNSPTAFGVTAEDVLARTEQLWREQLETALAEKGRVTLFAEVGGVVAGMMAIYWEEGVRMRHIAHLVGVYVKEEYRGQGVSDALLQALIAKARELGKVKIELDVTAGNARALKFYEKYGFQKIGTMRKRLLIAGDYYDEELMELLF